MMDHTLKIAATVLTQKQGGSTSDKGLPPQTTYCTGEQPHTTARNMNNMNYWCSTHKNELVEFLMTVCWEHHLAPGEIGKQWISEGCQVLDCFVTNVAMINKWMKKMNETLIEQGFTIQYVPKESHSCYFVIKATTVTMMFKIRRYSII